MKLSFSLLCFLYLLTTDTSSNRLIVQAIEKPQREIEATFISSKQISVPLPVHKILTPEHSPAILTALYFFPELRETTIFFQYEKINTTMQARPMIGSLFTNHRKYKIIINNDPAFDGIKMADVPFNAKVGLIGHELCHILDYEHKLNVDLAKLGAKYSNPTFKENFEKYTDSLTIEKGLGWQLFDWADFAMNQSNATVTYKAFKRKHYLEPFEIEHYLNSLSLYQAFKPAAVNLQAKELEKVTQQFTDNLFACNKFFTYQKPTVKLDEQNLIANKHTHTYLIPIQVTWGSQKEFWLAGELIFGEEKFQWHLKTFSNNLSPTVIECMKAH